MKKALVVLAVAMAVCSSGSLAALDSSSSEKASSNNLVQDKHDFQEDVKLPTIEEAESKMIDLDLADEEESSGDYLDDDQDIDKVDKEEEEDDYEEDYDEDDYDDDDDDWESSGDYDDDDDDEYLYDDDDYDSEEEDPDWSFEDDKSDNYKDEDLMYEYNNEDYEGDDYDFSQVEKTKTYQPPQITRSGRPTPHQSEGGDDVKVEVPSDDHGTSQNLLISVFVASGLASFALFTLAFVMCFCNRSRQSQTAKSAAAAVHNKQLFFTSGSSSKMAPPASSIIRTDRRYQPVPTHENRANHSIENSNVAISAGQQQKQLEEKLLMSA